jgi:hypothetical protein
MSTQWIRTRVFQIRSWCSDQMANTPNRSLYTLLCIKSLAITQPQPPLYCTVQSPIKTFRELQASIPRIDSVKELIPGDIDSLKGIEVFRIVVVICYVCGVSAPILVNTCSCRQGVKSRFLLKNLHFLCPFAVYYLRYAVTSLFTLSRISLADGKRAGQKVQRKIAAAVQNVKRLSFLSRSFEISETNCQQSFCVP